MSDVCKLSAGGPAPRDGCSCRSCVDARLAGRTAIHECVAGMGGWCITCRRQVAGRTTSRPYVVTWRDRLAIPVIKVAFYLASPAYRDRVKRLIVGGMKHGY